MKDDIKGQQRREAMGQDPIWRLLFRFSGPAIISMTVASSYNLIDAIFVGRLGPEALAAMSVTFPLVLSFIAIATGTAIGATSLITRRLGAGEYEEANRTASVALTLCLVLSGIIALVCLPNLDGILRLLGATDAVLPLARSYMTILVRFVIFSYFAHIMSSLIRADGNPVFASSVAISSSLLNIALDPVFIFGIGPIKGMGISGAATATVIAQGIGMTVYLIYIISGRTAYVFRPGYFLPRLKIIGGIYRIGIASIVRSGVQFVVMGVVNRTAASFGVTPLAIIGVLVRAGRFVQMPVIGLGQGMLPLVGYNYGARKKKRLAELIFKTGLAGITWTGLCWLLLMAFPTQVISAFNAEVEFLQEGGQAIRLYSMVLFVLGVQMVPGYFFQGIGRGIPASAVTASRHVFFLLPAILVLPGFFGLTGLWLSFPLADVLTLLLSLSWMTVELRRQAISLRWWRS